MAVVSWQRKVCKSTVVCPVRKIREGKYEEGGWRDSEQSGWVWMCVRALSKCLLADDDVNDVAVRPRVSTHPYGR